MSHLTNSLPASLLIALFTLLPTCVQASEPQLLLIPDLTAGTTKINVVIQNAQMPCGPFYVDRLFLPREVPNRPRAVLKLALIDGAGRTIRPTSRLVGTFMGARPQDLVKVDCGMIVGRVIDVTSDMWFGDLKSGEYRLRASLTIGTRSFVEAKEGYLAALTKVAGGDERDTDHALKDMELTSGEVPIHVK